MIALNEIISNKTLFEEKYKLMGKNICLDKIIQLEEDFIVLDKKANELRSTCNKLCSEIAELVNSHLDTTEAIAKINMIDKQISILENKSSKAMNKINKRLKNLPNLPLEDNVLNIPIKTKNTASTKENFVSELEKLAEINTVSMNEKQYIKSLKKVVFKAEDLPKLIKLNSHKDKYFLLCGTNALEFFEKLEKLLSIHSKYLVLKSIKFIKKPNSKELFATLSDKTNISVEFSGEFVSRENSIKLYDKNLDMTKFVNFVKITIR